jgi:hypothetical protein
MIDTRGRPYIAYGFSPAASLISLMIMNRCRASVGDGVKLKMLVEGNSLVVFGVNSQRAYADHIRDLERTSERVKQ